MYFLMVSNQFFKLLSVIFTLFFQFHPFHQFCWRQLMVKHVFRFPPSLWLSLCIITSFSSFSFQHSFLLLLFNSRGGIECKLHVSPLSFFFFIHPSVFTHLRWNWYQAVHPLPPPPPSTCIILPSLHAAKCTWSMTLFICALTSSVFSLFSVSSILWCAPSYHPSLCAPSEWYQQRVACLYSISITLPTTKVNSEWERDWNRHCLVDPSNHGLYTAIM